MWRKRPLSPRRDRDWRIPMATRRITAVERMNVLLEDIKAQNRVTLEAVLSSKEELERKFGERFERIEERLDRVEDAIRHHSKEIAELREELHQLRNDFAQREELARLDALERRVDALEKRRPH